MYRVVGRMISLILFTAAMSNVAAGQDNVAAGQADASKMVSESAADAVENANDPVDGAILLSQTLARDAAQVMNDAETTQQEKYAAFHEVLSKDVALDGIGRLVLGGARLRMSDEQQSRYNALFPEYISRYYAHQFSNISQKAIEVLEAREISARDVIVRSRIQRDDGSTLAVDWRVRKLRSGEQKMIDIIVSGVSIVILKREEFAAFIEMNGIEEFLEILVNQEDR